MRPSFADGTRENLPRTHCRFLRDLFNGPKTNCISGKPFPVSRWCVCVCVWLHQTRIENFGQTRKPRTFSCLSGLWLQFSLKTALWAIFLELRMMLKLWIRGHTSPSLLHLQDIYWPLASSPVVVRGLRHCGKEA